MFYNGTLETDTYYIQGAEGTPHSQSAFPYFDNYLGSLPTTSSLSLLFNNETAPYGDTPSGSLYSEYWSKYVNLLYNPYTRLVNCKAIIPLADYYKIELNDIVEWRGNYYHLRAINDYNLSNGECNLQLLGPVLDDVIANILPGQQCDFDFSIEDYTPPPPAEYIVHQCFGDSQLQVSFTSSLSMSIGQSFTFPSSYELQDCWYVSSSYSGALDLSDVSISQSFVDCTACSASLHPTPPTVYQIDDCSHITASTYVTFVSNIAPTGSFINLSLGNNCWYVSGSVTSSAVHTNVNPTYQYSNCETCGIPTGYFYNLQQIEFNCGGGVGHCTGFIGGNFIGFSTIPLVVGDYYNAFSGQVWCITGTTTPQPFDYNITSWAYSNYTNCGDAAQC